MKSLFPLLAGLLIILLTGCGYGVIYTHTIKPLDVNLSQTPISDLDDCKGDIKRLKYSVYVDIMWDSNAIGELYKRCGFSTIYYADQETFSLCGIWTQHKIHIYGK